MMAGWPKMFDNRYPLSINWFMQMEAEVGGSALGIILSTAGVGHGIANRRNGAAGAQAWLWW